MLQRKIYRDVNKKERVRTATEEKMGQVGLPRGVPGNDCNEISTLPSRKPDGFGAQPSAHAPRRGLRTLGSPSLHRLEEQDGDKSG